MYFCVLFLLCLAGRFALSRCCLKEAWSRLPWRIGATAQKNKKHFLLFHFDFCFFVFCFCFCVWYNNRLQKPSSRGLVKEL